MQDLAPFVFMPTLELRVAVWTVDTNTGSDYASTVFTKSTTPAERLGLLRDAVDAAWKWFKPAKSGEAPRLNVFLAPEYLFVKRPAARVLTMGEADVIETTIRDLSKGILLIPGTVVWKKPVDRNDDQYLEGSARGARALERRTTGYYKLTRPEKARAAIETDRLARLAISDKETPGPVVRDRIQREAKEKAGAFHSLESLAVVRNTAYGYHDGVRVLKYHKRGDYTEVLAKDSMGSDRAVFIPGAADGYFEVAVEGVNVPCGIEICGDHETGYLSNAKLEKTPLLHFITSAFSHNYPKHVRVFEGGYVVHASSRSEKSGVFTSGFEPLKPSEVISPGAGALLCYELPLEV